MVESKKSNPKCGKCKRGVSTIEEAVVCDNSERWFYRTCTDIPPEAYQFLTQISGCLRVFEKCIESAIRYHKDDAKTDCCQFLLL